jgi:hypothetical protein
MSWQVTPSPGSGAGKVGAAPLHLPASAGLFRTHLVGAGQDGFTLVREPSPG